MKKSEKEKIKKAIKKFNKYRSPEAKVRLVSTKRKSIKVSFSGPFCKSCSFYDYFDDLKIMMEEFNVKAVIKDIEETKTGAIVEFQLI